MSNFFDCLQVAVAGKEISQDEADGLFSRFDRYRRARGGGPVADAEAKAKLAELLREGALRKKRLAYLTALNTADLERNLTGFRNAKGEADEGRAMLNLFENFGEARFSSIEGQQRAIRGLAHGKMEAVLHEFRRSALMGDNLNFGKARFNFRKNQARLENVVREAFGEGSGDAPAGVLYRAFAGVADDLRLQFNRLGGAIPKLEGGWLPQSHDRLALLRAGKQKWKAYISGRLDWDRMRHAETGADILPDEIDGVLDDVYDAIVTAGWSKRTPSRAPFGKGALANQYGEGRFLHFLNATDWLDYQREFGEGDTFAAMMGYVNGMSRDIATMKVLGPNPAGAVEFLKQRLAKAGAGQGIKAENRVRGLSRRIETLFDDVRGALETPVNTVAADVLGGTRNFITSAVLGSAAVSAISDVGFQQIARAFNGMPETGIIRDYVKYLRTAPRREAVRAGLVLDSAQYVFQRQARYAGSLGGPQWTQWLADRTVTLSGLSPFTQAGRHAFGMTMMGFLGEQAGKRFSQLPEPVADLLTRWGFDEKSWDTLRKVNMYEPERGATFLRPSDIGDRELALKYSEMLQMETEFAVPSGSARGRAIFIKEQPGTPQGEFWRSAFQFKGFGVALAVLQGVRIGQAGGMGSARGARYAAKLLAVSALWGGLALQLKAIKDGKDPQAMNTPEFWAGAALQGGGMGIYGDFMFADLNRFNNGLLSTAAGPLASRLDDLRNLTFGNAAEIAAGKDPQIADDLFDLFRKNVPGSSIWYLRLAWERAAIDQINALTDPEAGKAFDRRVKRSISRTGQDYWWRPGQIAPERGPDVGAVAGG
jgi:hypothetical protein